MQKGYKKWIDDDKTGKKRHETSMRKFAFTISAYDNYLGLKAEDFESKWDKLK